jgi:GDPmannose 4,6-dehydratase
MIKNYREAYGLYACNGILFNHTSPRRGHNFVCRKITIGLGKIVKGIEDRLVVGNLDAQRDWGHARDYVEGMWRMLQQDKPDDFVLATGKMYSVRTFIEKSFALRGFDIQWKGEGVNEIGYDAKTGRELIFIDSKYFRPTEVEQLLGDASKAKNELGWTPNVEIDDLIREMVDHDVSTK